MLKIGVLGDLHLGRSLYGFDMSSYIKRAMWDFFEFCKYGSVDIAIQLGDVFDRSTPTEEHRKIIVQWCNEFKRARIPLRIIVGNHDVSSKESAPSALQYLKAGEVSSTIRIMDRPLIKVLDKHKVNLLFIPFPSSGIYEDFPSFDFDCMHAATGCMAGNTNLVFAHLNVTGARLGNQEFLYRGADFSVPDYMIDNDTRIFCGHIHKPQSLKGIEIVGAAERLRFDEAGQERYFGLITIKDGVVSFKKYVRHNSAELYQFNLDVSGVGNISIPSTDDVISGLASKKINNRSIIKLSPVVDNRSVVDWSQVCNWLYSDGASHVILDSPTNVEIANNNRGGLYVNNPKDAARHFIRDRVKDKKERKKLLDKFLLKLGEVS